MKADNHIIGEMISETATDVTAARPIVETVELVTRSIGGDFSAFGELYGLYLDRIFRYVYYQVKDRMTAEDITEEVFLKAWKAIRSCRGKEKTFSPWLYRIAHNHMINTLRNTNRFTPLEKVEISDPRQEIGVQMEYEELLKTLEILPENQREIIVLKFIEGLDNQEIGKILGKTEGAIRITQMRVLATLRQKLGKNPDTEV